MTQPYDVAEETLVISHLALRRIIGAVAMGLPVVLVLGRLLLDGAGLQETLSAYYYSAMRDVYVGALCVLAVCFVSYRGYDERDSLAGDLSCLFALGMALFPIAPHGGANPYQKMVGAVHLVSALCFFLAQAYFILKLFRRADPARLPTLRKLRCNMIYAVCAYLILVCLGLIAALMWWVPERLLSAWSPLLWIEALAMEACGLAWLVKGGLVPCGDERL